MFHINGRYPQQQTLIVTNIDVNIYFPFYNALLCVLNQVYFRWDQLYSLNEKIKNII